MNILVPQGIGDSIWALHKVQDLVRQMGGGDINILVGCFSQDNKLEARAVDFLSRFSFIKSAVMYEVPKYGQMGAVLLPGEPAHDGYYRYLPDGVPENLPGVDYVMMPNAPLERGIRLEDWLPQYKINWDIMNDFQFTPEEISKADEFRNAGEYVVFFLGSEGSNTVSGHNRGGIWSPQDWISLGQQLGHKVVVVGAEYDLGYFEHHIKPYVNWDNQIGKLGIGETLAIIQRARFTISYQSGIGIVSSYLGVPTAIFWRARGDSVLERYYVTFEEAMSSAWVNPKMLPDKHMPLIYGRHGVPYILDQIKERQW